MWGSQCFLSNLLWSSCCFRTPSLWYSLFSNTTPTLSSMADNETLILRDLQLSDYHKGYMDLLSQLTTVGDVSFDQFQDAFENLQKSHDNTRIFVVEDIEKEVIVASATLLVEFKFIHSCGKVSYCSTCPNATCPQSALDVNTSENDCLIGRPYRRRCRELII